MSEQGRNAPIDSRASLETPEHVALPVSLAGPGSRGLAWLVDLLLRLVIVALASVVLALAGFDLEGGYGLGTLYILLFLLDWTWYVFWEVVDDGRSPGKRVFGLRVIRNDGTPIGVRESLLRNLLRAADVLPGFYLVGAAVCGLDPRFRRLGDLVAGTIVTREGDVESMPALVPIDRPVGAAEVPSLPRHRRVGPRDRRALEEWLVASQRLGVVWSEWVALRVGDAFAARYRVSSPRSVRVLQRLIAASRQERPELERAVTSGQDQTRDLVRVLAEGGRLQGDAERASRLVWHLRAVVAELGRIREVSPIRAQAAEAAIWRAEVLLHRPRGRGAALSLRPALGFLFDEFPAALRGNWRWFLASSALFYVPLLFCFVTTALDVDVATHLVPPMQQSALEASFLETTSRTASSNAGMAGFYVINNVGIALRAAGAGVLFGVGTAWVLVSNGISIGAAFGYCLHIGALGNIVRFTCGHAGWELTAITVAGAAGLRLGAAVIAPGGRTRMASVRAAGPDVLRLASGAAAMLAVAAAIEGFWSGWLLPDLAKGVFAVVQLGLMAVWLRGRRR